jgi:macrodomain Ter protein organizer (MatP/YcbG family)
MDEVDEAVINYLENKDAGWGWFFGGTRLSAAETIERYKKDKEFRKKVKQAIVNLLMEEIRGE